MEQDRCEECHRTVNTLWNGEWLAENHFVCAECMGETKVFTMRDVERSERY